MTRPNFLVIGSGKCGTTTLCAQLARHPQVFISEPKEPRFFCDDDNWARGWDWYESHFASANGHPAVGEGSTEYSQHTVFPACAPRIIEHLPDARLIYMVRHPMRRIESMFVQRLSMSYAMSTDFEQAVREARDVYVDSSNYLREMEIFTPHYDGRIMVVFLEDYMRSPQDELRRCFEWLGVAPDYRVDAPRETRNRATDKRVERPLLKRLRRAPGVEAVKALAPRWLKDTVRERMKQPMPDRPRMTDALRSWIIDQIGDDTRRFLAAHDKPEDYWDLAN